MQQNPVLNHKKWFQLLSWTLYFTLPSPPPPRQVFIFVFTWDLALIPLLLPPSGSVLILWDLVSKFGFPAFHLWHSFKNGWCLSSGSFYSGCSEISTLFSQILILGPFPGLTCLSDICVGLDTSRWGHEQEERWSKETERIPGST